MVRKRFFYKKIAMIPNNIILNFDGGCWPNPGGTPVFGWQISDENGKILVENSGKVTEYEKATNNVAEYNGLKSALQFLRNNNWSGSVLIRSDSELVVKQIKGVYSCKQLHLAKLRDECLKLMAGKKCEIEWIPREKNKNCDDLANFAKSRKRT